MISFFFFFNDTATTEIYTLSLHDALPISSAEVRTNHDLDPVILQCDEPVLLEHRSVGGLRVADVRIDTVRIERGRNRTGGGQFVGGGIILSLPADQAAIAPGARLKPPASASPCGRLP